MSPRPCGWSGSRRGPRTAVWAGGLDSRPRIEKVVGDAGAWLPQRRRRLLVQVLKQRTGLARRRRPPREGQRVLSRVGSLWPPPPGWDGTGGAVEASQLVQEGELERPGCAMQARHALPGRGRVDVYSLELNRPQAEQSVETRGKSLGLQKPRAPVASGSISLRLTYSLGLRQPRAQIASGSISLRLTYSLGLR